MSLQRCMSCLTIKDLDSFTGKMKYCNQCIGKSTQTVKRRRSSKSEETIQQEVKKTPKDSLIDTVYEIAKKANVTTLHSIDKIDFSKITPEKLKSTYTMYELEIIIGDIEDLEVSTTDNKAVEEVNRDIIVDPFEIIARYKDGAITEDTDDTIEDEIWRQHIPYSIKKKLKEWETAPIELVYETSKENLNTTSGKEHKDLFEFVCDLSDLIFSEEEENDVEDDILSDEAVDAVRKVVEIIILPHVEVLDRIKENGGRLKFVDLWNKPFNSSLKTEVKDRDGWRCVICENDVELHVHHKIPRKLGGVHHSDNLVTLCGSCHKAVETADVQSAFKTCLANFRRQKAKGIKREKLSENKTILKEEVEHTLDKVLATLINRDDKVLVDKVTSVMKRLEVIFYD